MTLMLATMKKLSVRLRAEFKTLRDVRPDAMPSRQTGIITNSITLFV